jgi:hypothetical protein
MGSKAALRHRFGALTIRGMGLKQVDALHKSDDGLENGRQDADFIKTTKCTN